MKRTLVVSDIHGYTDCLRELLEAAQYVPGQDRLLLLGDYVNKGPDSEGALRLASSLVDGGAVALMGNNEDKLLRRQAVQPAALPWLSGDLLRFTRGLPLWHEDERYIYVHAGLRPGLPLSVQQPADLLSIRDVFYRSPAASDKTIVFGHTATHVLGATAGCIWEAPGKLGIDTGAGHRLRLSLVDLTSRLVYACDVLNRRLAIYRMSDMHNQAQ
ncbi:metallophosphoesterase [Paenibacillus sp. 1P07SE]|uniref:metallophosphoesterase n=1 Tax=Paenibacillus sp. 1P07SE TaxID=3132209 RepID=UPI0039A5EEB4